jgi:RNA recognition motif-containing protein
LTIFINFLRESKAMSQQQSKIYVGNLSFSTEEADLEKLFGGYGQLIELNLIKDNAGRSKGFAFITFENQKSAQDALQADNTELNGRQIRVSIAKETKRRGGGSHRGGQSRFRERY